MADRHSEELTALFAAYREALPDPNPSAGFMPQMWARIEVRRRANRRFQLLARRFIAMGGALATALALLVLVAGPRTSPLYSGTYVEVLAADQTAEPAELEVPAETL
ncbi:MAG TPA: hypothetical protein VFL57_00130 [Bryobacteraceae bacterium]|nr:hypothetical protein [Bryobacteraceae bacterium]